MDILPEARQAIKALSVAEVSGLFRANQHDCSPSGWATATGTSAAWARRAPHPEASPEEYLPDLSR